MSERVKVWEDIDAWNVPIVRKDGSEFLSATGPYHSLAEARKGRKLLKPTFKTRTPVKVRIRITQTTPTH